MSSRPLVFDNPHFPPNLPYEKQSVEVPGTKKPGQTGESTFYAQVFCKKDNLSK